MEGRPLYEAELIARAKSGQVSAYEELVSMHEETAFRAAYLVLSDASDAKDAAQEAFVKAYRALGRFKPDRPFRPWLVTIVLNEARNARKAVQRRGELAQRYAETQREGDPAPSPESAALDAERRRILLDAIGRLKSEDQSVIQMRYFLGLSDIEIAEALGTRRGTVRSRLSRASRRLRDVIERHYPDLGPSAKIVPSAEE